MTEECRYSEVPTNRILHPTVTIEMLPPLEDPGNTGLCYAEYDGGVIDDFFDYNGHIMFDEDGLENILENSQYDYFIKDRKELFSYYNIAQEIVDENESIEPLEFWKILSEKLVREEGWKYLSEE